MSEDSSVWLDLHTGCVWRGPQVYSLRPKTLAVLRFLHAHAGQFVSAETLRAAVWPGIIVSPGVLYNCIRELRAALGDERGTPSFIETLPSKGYRLIGALRFQQSAAETRPSARSVSSAQPSSPDLVGREAELETLQTWFRTALAGKRQLVFVLGEPGI